MVERTRNAGCPRLGHWNDNDDPKHGARGALLATRLRGVHFDLDDTHMDLLVEACRRHSDGLRGGDVTLLTCWDADRLDLGRVGITPDAAYLGTDPARRLEFIAACYRRSLGRAVLR